MAKKIFKRPRIYITMLLIGGMGAAILLPISGRVDVPAMVEPARYERIYSGQSAKLIKQTAINGAQVRKGDVLFELEAPELKQKMRLNQIKISRANARLARASADRTDKSRLIPLRQQLIALYSKQNGLKNEQQRLIVKAPFDGQLTDVNIKLHEGRWVKATDHLVTVITANKFIAKGYVLERDLWRVKVGDTGKFVPDDFLVSSAVVSVKEISLANSPVLALKPLASVFGGKISTRIGEGGALVPVGAAYQMTLAFDASPQDVSKVSRGIVQIQGIPESVAARIWRQVLRVLVRESGA